MMWPAFLSEGMAALRQLVRWRREQQLARSAVGTQGEPASLAVTSHPAWWVTLVASVWSWMGLDAHEQDTDPFARMYTFV